MVVIVNAIICYAKAAPSSKYSCKYGVLIIKLYEIILPKQALFFYVSTNLLIENFESFQSEL